MVVKDKVFVYYLLIPFDCQFDPVVSTRVTLIFEIAALPKRQFQN
jgi:hypothetical protein